MQAAPPATPGVFSIPGHTWPPPAPGGRRPTPATECAETRQPTLRSPFRLIPSLRRISSTEIPEPASYCARDRSIRAMNSGFMERLTDSTSAPSSTGTSTMRGFPRLVTMRGRPRSLRAQLASESCALVTSRVFIILKDFIAHLPPADADLLALLDAHRADNNGGRSLFDDVIVHPEITDTELPGGQRVRAHLLAIPGLHGGLGGQLNLDGVQQERALAGAQGLEMPLGFLRVLDSISHETGPSVAGSSGSIFTIKVRRGPEAGQRGWGRRGAQYGGRGSRGRESVLSFAHHP